MHANWYKTHGYFGKFAVFLHARWKGWCWGVPLYNDSRMYVLGFITIYKRR